MTSKLPLLPDGVTSGRKNPLCVGLADRLRLARLASEASFCSLARQVGYADTAIAKIEKGTAVPAIDTVELIAAALGVSPCWLAYGSEGLHRFQQKRPRSEAIDEAGGHPESGVVSARYKAAGERLKARRELLGLSLRQLAAAAAISVQTVANTEAGTTVPKVDNVERLAVALQCAPCWLAFGVGSSGTPH